jgi:hypothetical protein
MDKWLWAYASSTIWPIAVLLCASLLPKGDDDASYWIDFNPDRNVEEDDLAFHVAMITAAHI